MQKISKIGQIAFEIGVEEASLERSISSLDKEERESVLEEYRKAERSLSRVNPGKSDYNHDHIIDRTKSVSNILPHEKISDLVKPYEIAIKAGNSDAADNYAIEMMQKNPESAYGSFMVANDKDALSVWISCFKTKLLQQAMFAAQYIGESDVVNELAGDFTLMNPGFAHRWFHDAGLKEHEDEAFDYLVKEHPREAYNNIITHTGEYSKIGMILDRIVEKNEISSRGARYLKNAMRMGLRR
jgi:hypothetical protein